MIIEKFSRNVVIKYVRENLLFINMYSKYFKYTLMQNLVKENLMNLIENYPFVLKKKKINYN